VPPETPAHPRVAILGLLEARLLDFDRVVLGGLDESIWPPPARTDAFLNRPMRLAIGLTPPERRIGQTAHDLVQALGARQAVITRARKRGGAPTVPSRFLQRLQALAGPAWDEVRARGTHYTAWAAALDRADGPGPVSRPQPRPPRDLIPARLSVTRIETLIRDPYAIFAQYVLRLDALDELGVEPGAADRGNIIHEALGRFSEAYPTDLPPDALERLMAFGREAFAPLQAYPDIAAQYWPRFERLAHAFLRWEEVRRPALASIHAEVAGTLALDADGEPFTLTARADRIEAHRDGGFSIVDFKTGAPPSAEQVIAGFAPQLTLEAAMLRAGGFPDLPAAKGPIQLAYIIASGAADELDEKIIKPKNNDGRTLDEVIAEHVEGVRSTIVRYRAGAPFLSRVFPQFIRHAGPYDHLARVAEWSLGTDGEDAGDAGGEA
jgi:ATP-dependent helicase/nuclease subunit B